MSIGAIIDNLNKVVQGEGAFKATGKNFFIRLMVKNKQEPNTSETICEN